MNCRTCKKPKPIDPAKNCAVCGGADIRIYAVAICKCGAEIDVTEEVVNRSLPCRTCRTCRLALQTRGAVGAYNEALVKEVGADTKKKYSGYPTPAEVDKIINRIKRQRYMRTKQVSPKKLAAYRKAMADEGARFAKRGIRITER